MLLGGCDVAAVVAGAEPETLTAVMMVFVWGTRRQLLSDCPNSVLIFDVSALS